jgi:hypothetical protein
MLPRTALLPLIVSGTLALSACAPGDVELNGKVFDMVGIGSGSQQRGKVQVAERAPLVMPPSLERLPAPETGSTAAADASFPIDPETRGRMSKSDLERKQAQYCEENYRKPLALGDHARAAGAKGPLGLCAPSVLNAVGSSGSVR